MYGGDEKRLARASISQRWALVIAGLAAAAPILAANSARGADWIIADLLTAHALAGVRPATPSAAVGTGRLGEVGDDLHTIPNACQSNRIPQADAGSDLTVAAGEPVNFSSLSSDGDGWLTRHHWDFGDNATADQADATHVFEATGTYAVVLTVTDNCGAEVSDTIIVDVEETAAVSANFRVDTDPLIAKLPVQFTADAPASEVIAFLWTYSDGGSGYGKTVSHVFTATGVYNVHLKVIAADGQIFQQDQSITVTPGFSFIHIMTDKIVTIPRGMAMTPNTIWTTGDSSALATADVSDPANPVIISSTVLSGSPVDICIDGDLAAVSAKSGGVYFFDATRPANLAPVGRFRTSMIDGSMAYHTAINGSVAYVSCQTDLKLVDISNPANPVYLGNRPDIDARHATMIKGRLYVMDRFLGGYRIFDVSNPTVLVEKGSFLVEGSPSEFAVQGDLFAVAEGLDGVEIFNTASVDAPQWVGAINFMGDGVRGVLLQGDRMYCTHDGRIEKVNIANPANPISEDWLNTSVGLYQMAGDGQYLYTSVAQGVTATLRP